MDLYKLLNSCPTEDLIWILATWERRLADVLGGRRFPIDQLPGCELSPSWLMVTTARNISTVRALLAERRPHMA